MARTTGPDRIEHQKTFGRKIDAAHWISEQENAVRRGEWADPRLAKVTVGQRAKVWIDTKINLKPKSRVSVESLLRSQVMPVWQDRKLSMVHHDTVTKWISDMIGSGISASRARQAVFVLKAIVEDSVRAGYLPRNPMTGVKLPRARRHREIVVLTHQQLHALADAAGGPSDNGLMILVFGYTGLRWGEGAGLRRRRVDLVRRRLEISETLEDVNGTLSPGTPKNHEKRHVPLPAFLVPHMQARVAPLAPNDYVFANRNGGPLRNQSWRRSVLDKAITASGVPHITPHDLRHTAVSLMIAERTNPKQVQGVLGHASITTTLDLYGHLFPDELDAVAARLDAAYTRLLTDI